MMNDRQKKVIEVLLVRHLHDQNVVYFAKKHLNISRKRIPRTNILFS